MIEAILRACEVIVRGVIPLPLGMGSVNDDCGTPEVAVNKIVSVRYCGSIAVG